MNIFIDSNIFLSFYHFTSDDLEELKKLGVLLKDGRVHLFLPSQVRDEVRRNRENKIADALKTLRQQKLNLEFPEFCKDYEEYKSLRELQKKYAAVHAQTIDKILKDARRHQLKADMVIRELFDLATDVPIDSNIEQRAHRRISLGNPPGKRGSLGDALNWEALLGSVPKKEVIHFVTDDGDYTSPLETDVFNDFLLNEWSERMGSELQFYRTLGAFFQKHFPEISLASELEKDIYIRDLASSYSFAQTHAVIARLRQYSEFSLSQVRTIIQAALFNNQIRWVIHDEDVHNFLSKVIKGKEDGIDPEHLAELQKLLGSQEAQDWDDDDVPF